MPINPPPPPARSLALTFNLVIPQTEPTGSSATTKVVLDRILSPPSLIHSFIGLQQRSERSPSSWMEAAASPMNLSVCLCVCVCVSAYLYSAHDVSMYCNNVADMSGEEAATARRPQQLQHYKRQGYQFCQSFRSIQCSSCAPSSARLWLAGLSLPLSLFLSFSFFSAAAGES